MAQMMKMKRSAEFRREWSLAHKIMVKNTYFHVTVVAGTILVKTSQQKVHCHPCSFNFTTKRVWPLISPEIAILKPKIFIF